jgi:hypothetical protein
MRLYFDNEAMRAEVLRYLSIGMPIDNAKRIMQDSGFTCKDSQFTTPYLHCSAVYSSGLLISDEIHIFMRDESGRISTIEVDCHSVGP